MTADNYFKVTKGTTILGTFTFDSHSTEAVMKAYSQAYKVWDESRPLPEHEGLEAKTKMSVWHKRTIIMTEGPWSEVPSVGQNGVGIQNLRQQ